MERKTNIITGIDDLEHLHTIKNFPAFIGCTELNQSSDIYSDLILDISKSSGFIQVRKPLDPNIVYSAYHSEAIGPTWKDHHNKFSNFILNNLVNKDKIIEFGAGNGIISRLCLQINPSLSWTIVEVNPANNYHTKCRIIKSTIEDEINLISTNDVVVHSHTFEHLYDPVRTLRKISNNQSLNDRMIFSIPNLKYYLNNSYVNVLNFEHTFFLTDDVMEVLLKSYGYKIERKKYFNNHSIFYSCNKISNIHNKILLKDNYKLNRNLFLSMISEVKCKVKRYNKLLNKKNNFFIFGAHVFTQYLSCLGLKTSFIKNILDNSQDKQNKRLYGTSLTVKPLDFLEYIDEGTVILNAGQYQTEIYNQIKNINKNIRII